MSCAGCDPCPISTAGNKLFYQVHVTVEPDNRPTAFAVITATVLMGKAYRFENILPDGSRQLQWLTSETVEGSFEQAKVRMRITERSLKALGFKIIRSKIECSPNCPEVDKSANGYYECHLKVKTDKFPPEFIYSQNLDNPEWIHATYRKGGVNIHQFLRKLMPTALALALNDQVTYESLDNLIVEYTAYDSNRALDSAWEGN